MTAYMVMTHVLRSELALAVDSVKWLGRQRNSPAGGNYHSLRLSRL